MNNKSSQDIKLVERFMFESSVYMLNMFQKKIDSLISYKQKKNRQKQALSNRQQDIRIDPNHFFGDPIKTLARDLTKPIWNCVSKIDPVVYIQSSSIQVQNEQAMSQETSEKRRLYNTLLQTFLQRLKTEHQDESNLKININSYNCSQGYQKFDEKDYLQVNQASTRGVFSVLLKYISKQKKFIQNLHISQSQVQEHYGFLISSLQAYEELIKSYLEQGNQQLKNQVNWYINLSMQAILNMLDSRAGSTLLLIQPKIGLINSSIHPLLITVCNVLKYQYNYTDKEREKNKKCHNQSMEEQKEEQIKQVPDDNFPVFKDLKYTNCSKIAFINLDGYESEFNIDFAKYLCRNVMYISFPKESSVRNQINQLNDFQKQKSQHLLKKYYYQTLSQQQRNQLLRYYEVEQKQLKRLMFILPINSQSLNQKYNLKNDQNGKYNSIQFYESSFVKFMMQELVLNYLREYNPSCIIFSYSGKIKIQNQYFIELIKQLTVICNFKLLLYSNKTKMFCFQQKNEQVVNGQEFFSKQQKLYRMNEQNNIDIFYQKNSSKSPILNTFNTHNFNLDFLQKISIFLKVSSGTYNLSKSVEEDSHIEKYKNYKIMRYSALLLKHLGRQFPSIQKIKMRSNQYLTISKVLKNNYANKPQTFDKLFEKVVSKYHENLLKIIQKFLFSQSLIKQQSQINQILCAEEQSYLLQESSELIKNISSNYDQEEKKQIWENFKFQYRLQISTDKTESRVYLHIPKIKQNQSLKISKSVDDFIVAAEFQILDQKQKISVQLTANSKILYQKSRNHKQALIYVINHIPKQSSSHYMSFYGILNQMIQQKTDSKITLKPIVLHQQRVLSQFQHYIDFNYFQTNRFVFIFWPKIFNEIKQKLCRLLDQKYEPETTWTIFRAERQQPGIFNQIKVINPSYQYVIPRNGCTCYQYSDSINRFYMFGGFYNDTQNYFKFQTEVSYIDFSDQLNQAIVQSLPKSFFVLTSKSQQIPNIQIVNEIKNDYIRPKIGYEIFQPELKNGAKKQIYLVGGVGQKFTRPYSLISFTGSKIIFLQNGQIQSIIRIKTNNLLPVNIYKPVKIRSPQQMSIISNAQNRIIQLNEGIVTQQSYTLSHFRYKFDQNEDRFDFQTVYEFSDLEKRTLRDETQLLRKPPNEYPTKYELIASSFRGKQFNDNFIKVSSENGKKYIFELQLELSIEVKSIYQNYHKVVKLTGASIRAIDINASMLYCLIKHQFYTLDKCILAHFDINQLAGKLVDSKQVQINLKQIHKFDADVSKNIIVVANSGTVAVLHGLKLNNQIQIKQIILKKSKKLKTLAVLPCNQKSQLIDQKILNKRMLNQIATSFFINQNSGIIVCLTFKTIDRIIQDVNQLMSKVNQIIYVHVQKLDIKERQCRWSRIFEKVFKLQILSDADYALESYNSQNKTRNSSEANFYERSISSIKNEYLRLIEVKGNKQSKQKKQKEYLIKAIFKEQIYTCSLNIQAETDMLVFMPMRQSEEAYYDVIYKQNIKNESIMLQKGLGTYEQIKQEAYNYNMHGNHNAMERNRQKRLNLSRMIKEDSYIESEDIN